MFQVAWGVILIFLANLTTLLGYFTLVLCLTNILIYGTIFFCRRKPGYNPKYRSPAWVVMAIIAVAGSAWLAWGTFTWAPSAGLICAGIVVVTGLPFYFYWRNQIRKQDAAKASA
jgi:fructoselysine transporter